ncbi:MAG: ABC transporter substrate-binding protein [Methanobacteriaceae archaeon]|jgi:NitT/TauT family transport system substrate-binding protein
MEKKLILALGLFLLIAVAGYGVYSYYIAPEEIITIGHLPSDHHAALFVAERKGMFEREGIKIEMVEFAAGPELVKAAGVGEIDIGYVGTPPAITAIDRKIPLKVVASAQSEGSGIVVGNDTNIRNIEDLRGKKIAIPMIGSIQDVLLRDVLRKNNISLEEVNIIEMKVPLMSKALQAGEIDGFVAWEPFVTMAKHGGHVVLMYSGEIWRGHACCVIIATDDFRRNNPDALKKFLEVHIEATDYINKHPDEAASIVAEKLGTDVNVQKESLRRMGFGAVPTDEFINSVLRFAQIQRELELIEHEHTKEDIFDLGYLPTP